MNEQLCIKNFGPVKDVNITMKRVVIFIGDQGAGKSTIAKMYSLCRWMEKSLILGRITPRLIEHRNLFVTQFCKFHRMEEFFTGDTYIQYISNSYEFEYKNQQLKIMLKQENLFEIPKLLYVPSERSILSTMEKTARFIDKEMPEALLSFSTAYERAKEFFAEGYSLPFENFEFKYDNLNKISWIIDETGVRSRLSAASSGIQSSLPLTLVSEHNTQIVNSKKERELNTHEFFILRKKVTDIINREDIADSVKTLMLQDISSYAYYNSFVNIVEELEISLFPQSQVCVLNVLLRELNSNPFNQLILTTHSPYLLNAINISMMAYKIAQSNADMDILGLIPVPTDCQLDSQDVEVYALSRSDQNYCISVIDRTKGVIGDNFLQSISIRQSRLLNDLFVQATN